MPLDSRNTTELVHLIKDTFRIRANHNPIYVQIGDALRRIQSKQHQIVFGRRGSGKSCLLVHFKNLSDGSGPSTAVYVDVDAIKRLQFPDILLRILIEILDQLPGAKRPAWKFWKRPTQVEATQKQLRALLDAADSSAVEMTTRAERTISAGVQSRNRVGAKVEAESKKSVDTKETFRKEKLEFLERHLVDFSQVIRNALPTGGATLFVLIDDFYLIKRAEQPDVIDYLHRLFRSINAYLKVGTIRHRTTLRRHEQQTIGIELGQDVEEISLDRRSKASRTRRTI